MIVGSGATPDGVPVDGVLVVLVGVVVGVVVGVAVVSNGAPALIHSWKPSLSGNRPVAALLVLQSSVLLNGSLLSLTEGSIQPNTLLLAARTYVTLNEWEHAERTFRKALEANPQNMEAYGLLGSLYLLQGKLDGALKEFQAVASQDPASVVAHTMTGIIFERQNRPADAKEAYRRALAGEPKAFVAANNLAWLMAEDNETLDQALQLAQAARLGMPNSADVTDTIGWIYYKWGLHALAIEELKQAVRRQPSSAPFNYHLGLAYAKNGNRELAKQTLDAALKMDPKAAEASDARATLSRLVDKS